MIFALVFIVVAILARVLYHLFLMPRDVWLSSTKDTTIKFRTLGFDLLEKFFIADDKKYDLMVVKTWRWGAELFKFDHESMRFVSKNRTLSSNFLFLVRNFTKLNDLKQQKNLENTAIERVWGSSKKSK